MPISESEAGFKPGAPPIHVAGYPTAMERMPLAEYIPDASGTLPTTTPSKHVDGFHDQPSSYEPHDGFDGSMGQLNSARRPENIGGRREFHEKMTGRTAKSTYCGTTIGIATGGIVGAIVSAPVISVAAGVAIGTTGGLLVGKGLKRYRERRLGRLQEDLGYADDVAVGMEPHEVTDPLALSRQSSISTTSKPAVPTSAQSTKTPGSEKNWTEDWATSTRSGSFCSDSGKCVLGPIIPLNGSSLWQPLWEPQNRSPSSTSWGDTSSADPWIGVGQRSSSFSPGMAALDQLQLGPAHGHMRSHSCNAMVETSQPAEEAEEPREEADTQANPELVATNVRKDAVTTLMLRNVPNRLTVKQLGTELDQLGFVGLYDLCLIPIDPHSGRGRGYAFVNFLRSEDAALFCEALAENQFERASGKHLLVSIARLQGKAATLEQLLASKPKKKVRAAEAKCLVMRNTTDGLEPMAVQDALRHVRELEAQMAS
jgi:hypothetical protein